MKKNFAYPFINQIRAYIPIHILLVFMRYSFFVLLTMILSLQLLVANTLKGQDLSELKVKLEINNETLKDVLQKIQKKTNLRFAFKETDINTNYKVSIPKTKQSLKEILDLLFVEQGIGYNQIENNIILFKKENNLQNDALPNATISISGKVVDENGGPLVGVSIAEKGTQNGTITDSKGNFKLNVANANAILVFSYIGYNTKEILVGTTKNLTIVLLENKKMLDDILVVGYGGVKKKDATGAVSVIKPDESNRVKATTTTDLLLGKVAGLQITQGSGSPGSSGTVRIRQGASLNASNDPLIVVDGLTEGSLSSINPDDIESITVLKDASSSAIYGARGANGVIIVKTKKGSGGVGKKITTPEISYRGDFFINQIYRDLKVYDAAEFRAEYTKRGWNTALLGNANTDWQEEISRLSFTNKHAVSMIGSLPYTPYRVSAGVQEDQGTIIGAKNNTYNLMANVSPRFFNNHLVLDATVRNTYINTPPSGGSYVTAALTDPTQPVYFNYGPVSVNGVNYDQKAFGYFMYGADQNGNHPERASNPVASAVLPGLGKNTQNRLLTSALLTYKIHGFEALTLNVGVNSSNYNSKNISLGRDNTPGTWSTTNVNLGKGGMATNAESTSSSNRYVLDYYANYNKTFGKHQIDFTAGHSYESHRTKSWSSDTHYTDGSLVSGSVPSSSNSMVNLASYFGRLNYIFNQKYLLTGTLRADASSRFAPETRWGWFPSGAFAWKLNEENFLKNIKQINELKFRVSYGVIGQQNINNDYAYQATYYASTSNYMYREGDVFYTTYRPSAFDRSIRWELTKTFNIGLDYGFFNNRLYGAIDVYSRKTTDLLMSSVMVAAGSNFAESLDQNIGEMSSNGVEFAIGYTPIKRKNLVWNLNLNFAYNSSTIDRLTAYNSSTIGTFVKTGASGSSRYVQYHKVGNTPNTFFLAKQAYDANGIPIESFINPNYQEGVAGSAMYVSDDTNDAYKFDTSKSSLVPYYGGFSTSVKIKNYDFGLNSHYAFGQYVYWSTMSSGSNNSFFDASLQYPTNTYVGWAPEWAKQHYFSDYWLFKGDYFKIDNIVAGYTFNKLWSNKSTLRVALGVQNVATFTNYPGVDPEVFSGIDDSSTPKPRMFMVSASLKF